ncbi:MAG: phosphatase, partial [Zoogloea sp.]|nr:phosphatase [Zoogloea sp.]
AVIAHPGRLRMSAAELEKLFARFCDLGGEGVEVVSGSQDPGLTRHFASMARRYGLLASRASDFHGPEESAVDLGRAPSLPPDLTPIWQRLI